VLYFEAQNGTIGLVAVIYGINYGSLKFKAGSLLFVEGVEVKGGIA
jgi:hypothetical protein